MSILVLDIHRRNVTKALQITKQLCKYTNTTLLRLFSPDFSYENLKTYDGIVLSGSDNMSVYYDTKVRQLEAPLKKLSGEGTHVLGICGGNQVLARTYGYRRYKLKEPEVDFIGLNVKADNYPAIALYQSIGFKIASTYEEALFERY